MKKLFMPLIIFLTVIFILTGCDKTNEVQKNDKLTVVTSFYTMYDFASKLGGDRAEVINIMPSGTEVHDWEPSVKDISTIESADILVYNGAGMESWIDKVENSVSNQDLKFVETTVGMDFSQNKDPHVWLSPVLAKQQMQTILESMTEKDPENADYYNENFEKYSKEFDKLNDNFKEASNNFSKHEVIVAHEAYGYLCSTYGIEQIGIGGLSSHNEPSPVRMSEIINIGKENKTTHIFYEEMESQKTAQTIADELGAETAVLYSIEGISEEDIQSGADYFSLMYKNLEILKVALG